MTRIQKRYADTKVAYWRALNGKQYPKAWRLSRRLDRLVQSKAWYWGSGK